MIEFRNMASEMISNLATTQSKAPTDIERDGIIYCGVCGEKKQAWIDWFTDADGNTKKVLVPVCCKCQLDKLDAEEAENKRKQFQFNLRVARDRYGIQPPNIENLTFEKDDSQTSSISRACRKYVNEWDDMRKNNLGIIFYGSKGTGKSFYASCIVNALAEKRVPTALTTTALMMNILQGNWDKASVLENLNAFSLLVLDDLGAERDTAYGSELMYNIIDSRYRAKKPLVVTTNLDLADMKAETDIWRSRIYDRVIEMCPIPIRMEGNSRRTDIAAERKQMARDFLSGTGRGEKNGD